MRILKKIYSEVGSEDLSDALDVTIKFDELQRVSSFDNLLVNGLPKMPSFELTERVNEISKELLELPEKYKLKECKLFVKADGEMNVAPIYLLS
ncbi:hypothetical protein A2716_04005 [candidate division WWE3 bacterium RIFCSPHIGHO2_01_FULL_40_23]|uniref:Uncharacterized protein n=1 Tax=candidate division WWE3 bacterium RIFCSPLOWO2_01_FULL_41_18 TaxID=1802625 RepID=A0A1F4VDI8_UNCKA|nr:MAG: hypothetical protein A2716_04005 [candidate division WWE3 bacterium RIFCSPHIGHO2_01_FULL_40_23]OGC55040.1 MAG: hypothetical protein A3A78_03615 [candidate division WWE3 bacterium RIFCSPLOWO2_01_FULL_41_18]